MNYRSTFFQVLKLVLFIVLTPISALARTLPARELKAAAVAPAATLYEFVRKKARLGVARNGTGDAEAISRAIIAESLRYQFDPVLITAVIEHESGFGVRKRGRHGEIGLMQVKPSTARWMASRAEVAYRGPRTLEDPATNVRIGIAYLAFLRSRFAAKGSHFLAAYNMGQGNAARAIRRHRGPGRYARTVMGRYRAFYMELGTRTPTRV